MDYGRESRTSNELHPLWIPYRLPISMDSKHMLCDDDDDDDDDDDGGGGQAEKKTCRAGIPGQIYRPSTGNHPTLSWQSHTL